MFVNSFYQCRYLVLEDEKETRSLPFFLSVRIFGKKVGYFLHIQNIQISLHFGPTVCILDPLRIKIRKDESSSHEWP